MPENLELNYKYEALFGLYNGDYPHVDTVIITGGRGSGKSFAIACWALLGLVQYHRSTLYARFTNVSIEDSIKAEVADKIDVLNISSYVHSTINKIVLTSDENDKNKEDEQKKRIAFKGIKTGSKNETAKLKSLSNFNTFIVDEAEEIPDYEIFEKVYLSIRSNEKQNISVLILNPTTKQHWIYQKFFAQQSIPDGFCGVVGRCMYIHTSFRDIIDYLPQNILNYYNEMQIIEAKRYLNIVEGGWIDTVEGQLLPLSELQFIDTTKIDYFDYLFIAADPADTGGDNFAIIVVGVKFEEDKMRAYILDVGYSKRGIEATCEKIASFDEKYNPERISIESNGIGLSAVIYTKKIIKEPQKIKAYSERTSKQIRINSNFEYIKRNFVFDSNYKQNKEYQLFLNDATNFVMTATLTEDNKHKIDAIDVLSQASAHLKQKYKKYF